MAIIQGTTSNDTLYGTSENDRIYGLVGDDYLNGEFGNDILYGSAGRDNLYDYSGNNKLYGGQGNDFLTGGENNDVLYGGDGNDVISDYDGSDIVFGGNGNDVVSGVEFNAGGDIYIPGLGEIDTLIGGAGQDKFTLGYVFSGRGRNFPYVCYDDNNKKTTGTTDYALIKDFNQNQDKLQLLGTDDDYILKLSTGSLPAGTGIYVNKLGSEPDELIAILQGIPPSVLDLNASYFSYVDPNTGSFYS